jgi:hypothetical protein
MIFTPPEDCVTWQNNFLATTSSTPGTTITGSGTIHTKGSYTTVITATHDCSGFWMCLSGSHISSTDTAQLLDIAFGSAGNEVDVISNYLSGGKPTLTSSGGTQWTLWPIFVPAGTVIRARVQGLIASDTIDVAIVLKGGGMNVNSTCCACDTYGANTSTSGGVEVDVGTQPTWSTPVTIGTANKNYRGIALALGPGVAATSANELHIQLYDGSNVYVTWLVSTLGNQECWSSPYPHHPFMQPLPNGMTMQMRGVGRANPDITDYCYYCLY